MIKFARTLRTAATWLSLLAVALIVGLMIVVQLQPRTAVTPLAYQATPRPSPTPTADPRAVSGLRVLCGKVPQGCDASRVVAGPFATIYNGDPTVLFFFVVTDVTTSTGPVEWGWTMYVTAADGTYLGAD